MTNSVRANSIPVIGLTGSIGGGKSTVAKMLAEAGCVVSDSDALARDAFQDPVIRTEMIGWWGPSILDSHGQIDRSRIAAIVFPSANAPAAERVIADRGRQRLEALIHPWIHACRRATFAQAPSTATALVIDAPLLLESNMQGDCDTILMIDAPFEIRLERVKTSRGWSADELLRRENSQMPLDQKRKLAHHVLINDGSVESLRAQVAQILSLILADHSCRK